MEGIKWKKTACLFFRAEHGVHRSASESIDVVSAFLTGAIRFRRLLHPESALVPFCSTI